MVELRPTNGGFQRSIRTAWFIIEFLKGHGPEDSKRIDPDIATKTYQRWGKNEMPGDIAVDSINDSQMKDLNRLKEWLYRKRTQVRLERDRVERRQKREEEAEKREAEQPALFEF